MSNRLFIYAMSIHQGGGKTLLSALMNAFASCAEYVLCLDTRMSVPEVVVGSSVIIKYFESSYFRRLEAERWLVNNVDREDVVLCLGNLPPLFRLRCRTAVFLQNRYLVDDVALTEFSLRVRLRLEAERLWLTYRMRNVDEFIVQTPTMKRLLQVKTKGIVPVRVSPFVDELGGYTRSLSRARICEGGSFDFIYVASGEPHKNHKQLLEAWCLLASEKIYPSLCLTLDGIRFSKLSRLVDDVTQRYDLKVSNVGEVSRDHVLNLYRQSTAAIYPSTFESFGLPLLEARQAGIPILASELDYVRDVLDPEQTFDPGSPISIARAVKRFMGIEEQLLPLSSGSRFIASLMEGYTQ